MKHIHTSDKSLLIDNKYEVDFAYPIRDAVDLENVIVVLLDPNANLGASGQFKNLLAFDRTGVRKWVAELPTRDSSDVYWKIHSATPLIVYSFSSHECEIDKMTGRIKHSEFYK